MRETIVVLDYGSQYSQLIAGRVREAEVYCELIPHNAPPEQVLLLNPAGIILSGGPASVYAPGAPHLPDYVLAIGRPVLGICYGMQLVGKLLGGHIKKSGKRRDVFCHSFGSSHDDAVCDDQGNEHTHHF